MEIWKEIKQSPFYMVSNKGRIKSFKPSGSKPFEKELILKQKKSNEYLYFSMNKKRVSSHRTIWTAFNGEIPKGMQINHINGIKSDNRMENLELCTGKQNMNHALMAGLIKSPGGKPRPTKEEIVAIKFFHSRKKSKFKHNEILSKIFNSSAFRLRRIADGKLDHMV